MFADKTVSLRSLSNYYNAHHQIFFSLFPPAVCSRAFASKEDLIGHETIHSGEKRYQCHLCPKDFARKSDLTNHISLHQQEIAEADAGLDVFCKICQLECKSKLFTFHAHTVNYPLQSARKHDSLDVN